MSKKKAPPRKWFTFIDLFAGIGWIRLWMEFAGGKCVFTSEWDKSAQDTYEANFGVRPHGDITKIPSSEIPNHDFLVGGFPCQAFSICGDQKWFEDTRGTLFFEIERILKDKQPYGFLLENVRNLVSHDWGRTFRTILAKLQRLGYFVHWKVLDGRDFWVPQKRDRTIIVGFKQNHPFVFPTEGMRKPLWLADILEPDENVHPKHFLSETAKDKIWNRVSNKSIPDHPTIWHENKSWNIGINDFSCALRAGASYNYLIVNGKRRLTPREMLRLQWYPDSFKEVVVDTQLRKQCWNSVVVPLMEAVAYAMMEAVAKDPVNTLIDEKMQNGIFADLSIKLSKGFLCPIQ